ncbi:MAG: hypothetical protein M1818_001003 [Claussenomyces sp. TS43310]|nr:MAG: hypothetical protein M1818_001003 [Claussenomyces sp. TS43310]
MAEMGESGTASAAPAKRSLFKKSAWAKPPATESDEAIQLFSRSKEIFSDVLAENERRWLQKQANLGRARPSTKSERQDVHGPDGKRRRTSKEKESSESSGDDEIVAKLLLKRRDSRRTTPDKARNRSPSTPLKSDAAGSASPSPRPARSRPSRRPPVKGPIIALSDSEDEVKPSKQPTRTSPKISEHYDDVFDEPIIVKEKTKPLEAHLSPLEEDEEFPELVARARENARNRMLERLNPKSARGRSEPGSDDAPTRSESSITFTPKLSANTTPDPIIEILVTANIEGTKPLMIRRKLSQRIKDVRMAWCDKQVINGVPMSQNAKATIFLTWRGHRVFDVSTGRSLFNVGQDGKLQADGDGFENGRIHLEAWTDDLFKAHKEMLEEERKKQSQDPMDEEESSLQKPALDEEPRIRIILKAREYPDFKICVKPTTPVGKMISAFRKSKNIPADKQISLRLDGDELDPDSPVSDADMDDLTTVDVYIS